MIDLIGPDRVTAEWLTHVLAEMGILSRGSVVTCVAEPLPAMGFTGEFRRLTLGYDVEANGLPQTLIAKFSVTDPKARADIHSMGFYAREAAFYRELAAVTPVPTPECFYAAVDEDVGRCVILLQDLTSARRGRSTDRCSPEEVEHAIDAISSLHGHWWQNADADSRAWLDPEGIVPLDEVTSWCDTLWPAFVNKLSVQLTDNMKRFADRTSAELRTVMQRMFYERPLTVIHNDFQADNLLFGRHSDDLPLVVIDWQMMVRGRGPVDLAYLLSGSMDPEDRRRHERDLVNRYAVHLKTHGVQDYDTDECMKDYRDALLLPPARLAMAVANTPFMTPHPGAFWDVLFERQIRALVENEALAT